LIGIFSKLEKRNFVIKIEKFFGGDPEFDLFCAAKK
jgi:hypothetical protein